MSNRATLPAPSDTRLTLPPGAVIRDCVDLRTVDELIADGRRARAELERAMEACRLARTTTVADYLADVDEDDAVAVIR